MNQAWEPFWTWGPLQLHRLPVYEACLEGSLCLTEEPSLHVSLSVTQVPPFNLRRCSNFSSPPSPGSEGFFCARVWDYCTRKVCKCWKTGLVACGKHSGRFLDILVPRQTARCWQALCVFLWELSPTAEGMQVLEAVISIGPLPGHMYVSILQQDHPCCPVLVYITYLAEKKRPYKATAGHLFLLTGKDPHPWQVRGWFQLQMVGVYKDQPSLK